MNPHPIAARPAPQTAPPIRRTPMLPKPWFGALRGLLFALMAGPALREAARATFAVPGAPPAWQAVARQRRRVLLAIVAALAATALALQLAAAPEQPSAGWWAGTALATLLFAWVGVGFATALMGALVLARGDRHALELKEPHAPIDPSARTALIMPICNEDIATVFGGLRATCESLAATGALRLFDVYVLSDTSDPALRAAELRAWETLRATLGDGPLTLDGDNGGARIFYRWRRRRTKRKAGNVADFCRRWGSRYRYMVVLDADSTMHGDTLVSLVRLMEQQPRAGIIQTLPQASGHSTLHARLQQFSSRVTGRLFSAGMAYWQLGESHYWGHNAILRVEPFMRHCGLARLPGRGGLSGDILSHDFVEAALMGRAGQEVWLVPQLGGSWEQNPPDLLDELQRDRRWCQGNLQNARLIAEPGWRPAHRVMFATGALSYLAAPLWLAFVVAGLVSDRGEGVVGMGGALWVLTLSMLVLPRLLGVLAVRLRGEQSAFGGSRRLAGNALLELLLSAVQAPLRMLAHSAFVVGALTGLRLDWKSPSRDAASVGWRHAFSRIGLLASAALAAALLALWARDTELPVLLPQWLPLLLPLALALPFTVYTGSPLLGRALDRLNVLWMADEHRPPRTLARAAERQSFVDALPSPAAPQPAVGGPAAQAAPARRRQTAARRGFAMAMASTALVVMALLPNQGVAPELSAALQAERDLIAIMDGELNVVPADAAPVVAEVTVRKRAPRPRVLREQPARMIDDAVRQRALEAVEQALAIEGAPA